MGKHVSTIIVVQEGKELAVARAIPSREPGHLLSVVRHQGQGQGWRVQYKGA